MINSEINARSEPASVKSVLACIVTYNPDAAFARHLEAISSQANALVVVDNASGNIDAICQEVERCGGLLIKNTENLGIAAALNQAVDVARDGAYEWLATYDQDSLLRPGTVERLLALHASLPIKDKVGIITPTHLDRARRRGYAQPGGVLASTAEYRVLRTAITSGCLIRVDVALSVGPFDESLFIDCVDQEFSLRCRQKGFIIVEGYGETIEHMKGEGGGSTLFGLKLPISRYNPSRIYYINRNQLTVSLKYVAFDSAWSIACLFYLVVFDFLTLLSAADPIASLKAIALGVRDFLSQRSGRQSYFN